MDPRNELLKTLLEEALLLEATADEIYTKYYSAIPREEFNQIVGADPVSSNLERGRVGMYAKWLLDLYKGGRLLLEDLYKATEYIPVFDKLVKANKVEDKNLNNYKGLPSMYKVVEPYLGGKAISKGDEIRNVKNNEVEKIYDGADYLIVVPLTKAAAIMYGKNTTWCTSSTKSENPFDHYNKMGKLYIIIDKRTGEKFQFHFETQQFMDANDEGVDICDHLDKFYLLLHNSPHKIPKVSHGCYTITNIGRLVLDKTLSQVYFYADEDLYLISQNGTYDREECLKVFFKLKDFVKIKKSDPLIVYNGCGISLLTKEGLLSIKYEGDGALFSFIYNESVMSISEHLQEFLILVNEDREHFNIVAETEDYIIFTQSSRDKYGSVAGHNIHYINKISDQFGYIDLNFHNQSFLNFFNTTRKTPVTMNDKLLSLVKLLLTVNNSGKVLFEDGESLLIKSSSENIHSSFAGYVVLYKKGNTKSLYAGIKGSTISTMRNCNYFELKDIELIVNYAGLKEQIYEASDDFAFILHNGKVFDSGANVRHIKNWSNENVDWVLFHSFERNLILINLNRIVSFYTCHLGSYPQQYLGRGCFFSDRLHELTAISYPTDTLECLYSDVHVMEKIGETSFKVIYGNFGMDDYENMVFDTITRKLTPYDNSKGGAWTKMTRDTNENKNRLLKNLLIEYLEGEEVTYYQFLSELKLFLKELLNHPVSSKITEFFKSRGYSKSGLINYMVKTGLIERNETVNTEVPENPTLETTYKVPKKGFEFKTKLMFVKFFETKEINEDLEYYHADDANPESDEYSIGIDSLTEV